jgi:hypothetical protein
MEETVFLSLIIGHWFGDYVFQTEKMGLEKSKSLSRLLEHTLTYSLFMFGYMLLRHSFSFNSAMHFFFITLLAHTLTDFISSRLTSYYYKKNKMYGFPGFWTIIGLDQVFHIFQLVLTYKLLK